MKTAFYILAICFLIACASKKDTRFETSAKEKPVRIANDSLSYEIIIMDIGFNRFLNSVARPRDFYSLAFLETKNIFFVNSYNIRANNPIRYGGQLYGPSIDYRQQIRYGYEVNYLLYNYFLFFQQKYRQRL